MQLNKIDPVRKETLNRRNLINTKATKPFLPKTRSIVVKKRRAQIGIRSFHKTIYNKLFPFGKLKFIKKIRQISFATINLFPTTNIKEIMSHR